MPCRSSKSRKKPCHSCVLLTSSYPIECRSSLMDTRATRRSIPWPRRWSSPAFEAAPSGVACRLLLLRSWCWRFNKIFGRGAQCRYGDGVGAFSRTTITNLMEFVDGGFGGCDGFIKARTEHSARGAISIFSIQSVMHARRRPQEYWTDKSNCSSDISTEVRYSQLVTYS